jgi:hypothetical protein
MHRSPIALPLQLALAISVLTTQAVASFDFHSGPVLPLPDSNGRPTSIALGDLNKDGVLDIVVGSGCPGICKEGSIAIFIGKGDGNFETPTQIVTQGQVVDLKLADVNNDGSLDIVTLNGCPGGCSFATPEDAAIQVSLGNGDGTFQPVTIQPTLDLFSTALAVADFDLDGLLDAAWASDDPGGPNRPSFWSVRLGNGSGLFPAFSFATFTGRFASSLVAGDFNGDGKPDLAVIRSEWGEVHVWFGLGDGTFAFASSFSMGHGRSIMTADINGDGKLDIAVSGASVVRIAYGNGDGSFQKPIGLATYRHGDDPSNVDPKQVIVSDFDNDGRSDLALACGHTNQVALYHQNSNGRFSRQFLDSAGGPVALAAGDLNNDGAIDLVVLNVDTNSVAVFINILP